MSQTSLYPLKFNPICQYRLWGGRRLENLLPSGLPGEGPYGEAWLLSDRDDFPSIVSEGPLKGKALPEIVKASPEQVLGKVAARYQRFPLLLKFLDAKEQLSVQVHPTDEQKEYLPPGEHGKTEAWVVLDTTPESRIYAGLMPGTDEAQLKRALSDGAVKDLLASFNPKVGDGLFIPAGTVHALGGDVLVFEVQENSDVTFRLYDWDRVDPKSGQPRELQIDQAVACIDFTQGPKGPVIPKVEGRGPTEREELFLCEYFALWRLTGAAKFQVGTHDSPTVLVCLEGEGTVTNEGSEYAIAKGEVMLLPAAVGACVFQPLGSVNVLEIALPDASV